MDLTAKVTALEEEVGVLKGEIKLILQEVRTALLARENPFVIASTESLALPASLRDERGPSAERGTALLPETEPPAVFELPGSRAPAQAPAPKPPSAIDRRHEALELALSGHPAREEKPERLDVPRIAALVNWTQETTARHSASDVSVILSLARYGGLIEGDLEATLTEISRTVTSTSGEEHRASIFDLLVALRQLEAMVGTPQGTAAGHRTS